jgi:Fe-S-cluster containining protein
MLKSVPPLAEFDRGDGICRHLENNLCTIYESRPLVCNVEKMFNAYYNEKMSEDEYVVENIKVCKFLQSNFMELKQYAKL